MTFKPNSLRTVMLMAVAPVIGLAFQSCGDDTDDYPTVDGKAPTLSLKTNPEPYWRFDGSEGNEKNVLNGGDNMKGVEVKTSGTYLMEFDYSLLRSRITLVK